MVQLSRTRSFSVLAASILLGVLVAAPASAVTSSDVTITSFDGTPIVITVCQPDGASAGSPVPVILHGHGWGGSRSGCGSFGDELAAGFGVVSIDFRGFGASGGQANVHDPDFEGRDVLAIIDYVAGLPWVELDAPGDPVMGAIGGSYGGGYQFMAALLETAENGDTRLDALAPEITWYDLTQALAPNGVVRTAWVSALFAAGAAALPSYVHEGYAYTMATGMPPDGSIPGTPDIWTEFRQHGPVHYASQGIQLDIPVLIGQGHPDTLFNLNEGLHNFFSTLTPAARAESYFIGYNGGHVLPFAYPPNVSSSGDPCSADALGGSGNFGDLAIQFFNVHLKGVAGTLPAHPIGLATADTDRCVWLDDLPEPESARPRLLPNLPGLAVAPGLGVTLTGLGAPVYLPLVENAEGGFTLAGIPRLSGTLTAAVVEARAFVGLAVGATPATAQIVDQQWMPIRAPLPEVLSPLDMDMAAIAIDVPEGDNLYLVLSPLVDQFALHGSRVPGAMVFTDLQVDLPVIGDLPANGPALSLHDSQPVTPTARGALQDALGSSALLPAGLGVPTAGIGVPVPAALGL